MRFQQIQKKRKNKTIAIYRKSNNILPNSRWRRARWI